MFAEFITMVQQNTSGIIDSTSIDNDRFQHIPVHVHWKDINGKYIAANRRTIEDAGFKTDNELIGLNDLDILIPEEANNLMCHDEKVRKRQKSHFFIEPFSTSSGSKVTAISCKNPLFSSNKQKLIGTITFALIVDKPNFHEYKLLENYIYHGNNEPKLTEQEYNCLFHTVKGLTAKQIAKELNISYRTVESYLANIKNKLKCHTRAEMISWALQCAKIRERL